MGLEDREYLRDEALRYGEGGNQGGFGGSAKRPAGPKRMVTYLVIICCVLYLVDSMTPPINVEDKEKPKGIRSVSNQFFDHLALKPNSLFSEEFTKAPWKIYQLLTYGFAHASLSVERGLFHLLVNMLILWQLGRFLEDRIGRKEFLLFFLSSILFTGILIGLIHRTQTEMAVIGSAAGVTATVLVFALKFPEMKLHLFGALEVPGWLIGVIFIGLDFLNAAANSGDRIAFETHIGGAAFGLLYFYSGIRLSELAIVRWFSSWFSGKPRLRIHTSNDDELDEKLQQELELADEVLKKVHREGESSLSRKERKILERYSRRVRQKKNQ